MSLRTCSYGLPQRVLTGSDRELVGDPRAFTQAPGHRHRVGAHRRSPRCARSRTFHRRTGRPTRRRSHRRGRGSWSTAATRRRGRRAVTPHAGARNGALPCRASSGPRWLRDRSCTLQQWVPRRLAFGDLGGAAPARRDSTVGQRPRVSMVAHRDDAHAPPDCRMRREPGRCRGCRSRHVVGQRCRR